MNDIGSLMYELDKSLSRLLKPLVGKINSFMKDSSGFADMVKNTTLESRNTNICFNVVYLFTKISLESTKCSRKLPHG